MTRAARARGFTVSGPGVDRDGLPSGPVALSAAITIAERVTVEEGTFYVRDADGDVFGRVERTPSGLEVYRVGADR